MVNSKFVDVTGWIDGVTKGRVINILLDMGYRNSQIFEKIKYGSLGREFKIKIELHNNEEFDFVEFVTRFTI